MTDGLLDVAALRTYHLLPAVRSERQPRLIGAPRRIRLFAIDPPSRGERGGMSKAQEQRKVRAAVHKRYPSLKESEKD